MIGFLLIIYFWYPSIANRCGSLSGFSWAVVKMIIIAEYTIDDAMEHWKLNWFIKLFGKFPI